MVNYFNLGKEVVGTLKKHPSLNWPEIPLRKNPILKYIGKSLISDY